MCPPMTDGVITGIARPICIPSPSLQDPHGPVAVSARLAQGWRYRVRTKHFFNPLFQRHRYIASPHFSSSDMHSQYARPSFDWYPFPGPPPTRISCLIFFASLNAAPSFCPVTNFRNAAKSGTIVLSLMVSKNASFIFLASLSVAYAEAFGVAHVGFSGSALPGT